LIEGDLKWVLIYFRGYGAQANLLPPHDAFQGRFGHIFSPIAKMVVTNKLKTKADHQGIGRLNAAEVLATGKEDLRAISAYLGSKEYLAGDEPNKLDATAFAYLSQFWYAPGESDLKTFIQEECANLVTYLDRVKTRYWSDWDEKLRKPAPPREKTRKSTKDESQAVVAAPAEQENANENKETATTEPAAVNGCPEKEKTPVDEKATPINEVNIESTVEIVNASPAATITAATEGKEKAGGALEISVAAEEQKHASTPNGGSATAEKTAE